MLEIKGKVKSVKKVKVKCPKDGVHRPTGGGHIIHPRVASLNGKPLYFGNEAFYWWLSLTRGIKVYYSFRLQESWKKEKVEYIRAKMFEFGDICAQPYEIIPVNLNLSLKKEKVRTQVWGLHVENVCYPNGAWLNFCKGYPYDWNADDHPDHSVAGFLKFRREAKKRIPDLHKKSLNLGGTAWDIMKERWVIMDVDWRKE